MFMTFFAFTFARLYSSKKHPVLHVCNNIYDNFPCNISCQNAGLGDVAQSDNQHFQVVLAEARPEAFQMVLWFIYTDKLDWRPEGTV